MTKQESQARDELAWLPRKYVHWPKQPCSSRNAIAGELFFLFLDFHGFKVFGLKDLAAVETFDVIDAVSSGNHLGTGVVASGLHNSA